MEQYCENCKYTDLKYEDEPCRSCCGLNKWEPKETGTIIERKNMQKEQIYDARVVARQVAGEGDDAVAVIVGKIEAEDGSPLRFEAVSEAIVKELIGEKHGTQIATFRDAGYDVEYLIRPFQAS